MGLVGGAMMDNMAALGVTPAEITDVIFTHLHIDHIGWATQQGATTFPNATYRCSQADWEHFMVEHKDEPDDYPGSEGIPVNPHAVLVHATTLFRHLRRLGERSCPASTSSPHRATRRAVRSWCCRPERPGHAAGRRRPLPGAAPRTEWDGLMDVDPALAKRTRADAQPRLDGADIPVAAAHFPDLHFGRLLKAEGTRRFVF